MARVVRDASHNRVDPCACRFRKIKYEKGIWWMPWRTEAMKDVARCDKPR